MSKACSCTFALLPLAILIGLGIGHFSLSWPHARHGSYFFRPFAPLVLLLLAWIVFFDTPLWTRLHWLLGLPLRVSVSLAWEAALVLIPILACSFLPFFWKSARSFALVCYSISSFPALSD